MEAIECIKGRRSIRKFKPVAVDHSIIENIVEAASFSPSWKNTQIARYYIVEGDLKDKVASESTLAFPHNGEIIKQAPMLVVMAFVKSRSGFERDGSYTTNKKDGWQMFDTGIATQSFTLAAHEAGLGTVIMGIFDDAVVSSILEIPDTQEVACLIPIGYPDEAPTAPKRKEVSDLLTFK
ncbi:MAG: nitroreductase family protein [Lachnospiraceae bacterium]|nr:nitroreductase family protein [Lachnospiraceae bacterium]